MQSGEHILVTGGAGYIGSHTVVELVRTGYTPVIVDDFRNANKTVLQGLATLIGHEPIIHVIDVCDLNELRKVFDAYSFKGIIHFAAYKAVGESVEEPLKYYRNNILGLVNILELFVEYQLNSFVFSSSCTVYGDPGTSSEVTEDTPVQKAISPYGNTKIIGEQILKDLSSSNPGLKMIALRYFNPIGAHPTGLIGEYPIGRPNNLLPFVTQTAIGKQKELTVFGNDYATSDGTCIRDYIHVCDLADAHVKALDFLKNSNSGTNQFVNIGTGKGTSVLELINSFEKISGKQLNWKFGPRRSGDVPEIFANVEKSKSLLHWEAKYTVNDAIEHAWNWEQNLLKNA